MAKLSARQEKLVQELVDDLDDPSEFFASGGFVEALQKRFVEKALEAEMTDHLGYERHARSRSKNSRNGKTKKRVVTATNELGIEVPRDREGTFDPKLVRKRQVRLEGFDEKVIALYSRGQSTREIQRQLEDFYKVDVSPALISRVTDAVMEDVRAWQHRPLEEGYPIIYFDALYVKSRQEGSVQNKPVHLALAVNWEGHKEVLGLWIAKTEGAKYWLSIFNELRNRGLKDVLVACCDGLKGLPEAIEASFPEAQVQLCLVHQVRSSLKYVTWKDQRAVAKDLKSIYRSSSLEEAEEMLEQFKTTWDPRYPMISRAWQDLWPRLTVLFDFPPEIRKVIYTTNAIESLNFTLRKVLKKRGAFPTDESITKILYLALHEVSKRWTMPVPNWKPALNQLVIHYGDRVTIR